MIVFEMMAKKHWTKYLPKMTADLKKKGIFERETKEAALAATRELVRLVQHGAQMEASKEIVLQEYILLPPEKRR